MGGAAIGALPSCGAKPCHPIAATRLEPRSSGVLMVISVDRAVYLDAPLLRPPPTWVGLNPLIYLRLRTLLLPQCFLEPGRNISAKMATPPSL